MRVSSDLDTREGRGWEACGHEARRYSTGSIDVTVRLKTPAHHRESARKAAQARWAKRKGNKVMSEIRTAKSPGDQFRVEPQPGGSFRIYNLTPQPLPITREQALAWLKWMEDDGVKKLRQLLKQPQH
jgi:hypothetical protein